MASGQVPPIDRYSRLNIIGNRVFNVLPRGQALGEPRTRGVRFSLHRCVVSLATSGSGRFALPVLKPFAGDPMCSLKVGMRIFILKTYSI